MNASVVFVLLIIAVASAFPSSGGFIPSGLQIQENEERQDPEILPPEDYSQEERGVRFRRVTCDLLSFSIPAGSLNHSACAAHCLAMRRGYRGGRCRDGVCHCRK